MHADVCIQHLLLHWVSPGVPATDEGKAAEQEDIDDRGKSLVELHKEQQQKNLDDAEEAARKDRKRKKKRDKKSKKHKKRRSPAAESDSEEEDEDAKRAKKIKQAMEKQKADDAAADKLLATDERSRCVARGLCVSLQCSVLVGSYLCSLACKCGDSVITMRDAVVRVLSLASRGKG